jgi:hypothetical protein
MSYSVGNILSYEGLYPSSAIIVTNGNVMITKGLGAGTIIKLADWRIMAGGQSIRWSMPAPRKITHCISCSSEMPEFLFHGPEGNCCDKCEKYYQKKSVVTEECGCRSDGFYCDTHLYQ